MSISFKWPIAIGTSIFIGLSAGVAIPEILTSASASAQQQQQQQQQQSSFPDVEPDYWATPFIQALAAENILVGYPDGTFRPRENIDRDEFAAVVRKAFKTDTERQIPSGSAFNDVPQGYWAEPAIEEAYQTGFMQAFSNNNLFYPRRDMTKADAIVAIARGLELTPPGPASTAYSTTAEEPIARESDRPKVAKRQLVFPLASTALMYPLLLMQRANAQTEAPPRVEAPEPTAQEPFAVAEPGVDLNAYYADADRIPDRVSDAIAAATDANIIVNYPDPTLLNPSELLNRGAAAALVYQSLVYRGTMEPLPENSEATNYIVDSPNYTTPKTER